MSGAALTDATLTRVIRRIIATPGTCSDSLLAVADAIAEAARSAHTDGAEILRSHAEDLRRFARYFAEAAPPVTALDAARILIRAHKPTEGEVANAFTAAPEATPMNALLGDLLTAAELEAAR